MIPAIEASTESPSHAVAMRNVAFLKSLPLATTTCRLHHGPTRMSKNGAVDPLSPIRFADILFANVTDPNGKNPKTRRVVVLTPDFALKARYPIVVAGVTGTLPDPLTADYVLLPFKNSPGRHPKTGMTKKAGVLCTWVIIITQSDVQGRSGFVPPAYMAIVSSKTESTAKAVGGWP